MPEEKTLKRARADLAAGKSKSTAAGEFVREEIDHLREGKHGARSAKQAIAIGLSKARRAGVSLAAPAKGKASAQVRTKARQDLAKGKAKSRPSAKRSRAVTKALKKEPTAAGSHRALSRQARSSAARRGPSARKQAAKKAVATKGPAVRRAAARKAARTRART